MVTRVSLVQLVHLVTKVLKVLRVLLAARVLLEFLVHREIKEQKVL